MPLNRHSKSGLARELRVGAWDTRRWCVWSAPAAIALLLLGLLVVADGDGIARTPYWPANQTVFLALNSWLSKLPVWLWSGLTLLGDAAVLFSFLALFVFRKPQIFAAALASVPVGGLFSVLAKRGADVLRPPAVLESGTFTLIGPAIQFHSFPSGHTITAFAAAAAVLATLTPSLRRRGQPLFVIFCLMVALGISLSRIAVGVHWPLDIAAGASAGWLAGLSGAALAHHGRWWRWMFAGTGRWITVIGLALWGTLLLIRPHETLAEAIVLGLSGACVIGAALGMLVIKMPNLAEIPRN